MVVSRPRGILVSGFGVVLLSTSASDSAVLHGYYYDLVFLPSFSAGSGSERIQCC